MPKTVANSDIEAAAKGNPEALRSLLTSLVKGANAAQPQSSTAGNPPPQASGKVVFQNPNFVVTVNGPGSGATPQQAAQGNLGSAASVFNVYYQVRCATSLLFDSASNVVTYGGDTGSLQTQFIIADVDTTDSWYFQIRSSYDGQNWNAWKTLNSGNPLNGNPDGVIAIPFNGGTFALIELAGGQRIGIGQGTLYDQGQVFSEGGISPADMFGVSAPNGYSEAGHPAHGLAQAGIAISQANGETLATVSMKYEDGSGNIWPGSASMLLAGFVRNTATTDPTVVAVTNGNFAIFTLPGGTQLAIGCGVCAPGQSFTLPPGFVQTSMFAIASPGTGIDPSHTAHGINNCGVTGLTPICQYADGSGNTWEENAQWFAVCWTPVLDANVQSYGGNSFLILNTQSGKLCIGTGVGYGGTFLGLPAGFSFADAVAFASPATFDDSGNYMHGIETCALQESGASDIGELFLVYEDGEGHQWSGTAQWMVFAWQ